MAGKRKRGTRLTLPPKKRSKASDASNANAPGTNDLEKRRPTKAQYATWTSYRSFIVVDANDEPVTFRLGGYGLIVPQDADPRRPQYIHEYWVGKIREIRSRGADPTEVWAKVQWLWSAQDITVVDGNLDVTPFGQMERLTSSLCDFVHSSCFQDVAHVMEFDESVPEPPLITDETFYVRHSFDYAKRTISPVVRATCLCGIPYDPDCAPPMHFCPRKKCKKAYHAKCLRKHGWVTKLSKTSLLPSEPQTPNTKSKVKGRGKVGPPRALQFERTLPDSTVKQSLEAVQPDLILLPSPVRNARLLPSPQTVINASASQTPRPRPKVKIRVGAIFTRYDLIPRALLALARSPMVRGPPGITTSSGIGTYTREKVKSRAGTGLPEEGCVAGNVAFVARARMMVQRVIKDGEAIAGDWYERLGLPKPENEGEPAAKEIEVDERKKRRKQEEEVMKWVVEDDGLLCPSCNGVI